jgi:hypothetical protein
MKFKDLCEKVQNEDSVLNEKHLKKGTMIKITASPADLGPKFAFKPGEYAKVVKFIGYQANDEEYEVKKGGKTAILPDSMFEVINESELSESKSNVALKNDVINGFKMVADGIDLVSNAFLEDDDFSGDQYQFSVIDLKEYKDLMKAIASINKKSLDEVAYEVSAKTDKLSNKL